jgi:Ca2+-binding RTX toxin-like protein
MGIAMPATSTYGTTGNAYLDGLLGGIKWGVNSLTFSFPSQSSYYGSSYGSGEHKQGFEALNATQQSAVREILKMYASVSNLTFTEVTETASVHGDLRYAESDQPATAWAYFPSVNVAGGDTWLNNSKNWYDAPVKGNYAWTTLIHETGHALGLKHPHQASGSFGILPTAQDSLEYTVMSYRAYVGASTTTGYTNGATSFPQTLMMHDIAAIQKLYGANYTTNSGNTVYSWNPTTAQMSVNGVAKSAPAGNKIFMTLWDGGGTDTYDFGVYTTGLKVDLNPGAWTTTSSAQLASLGSGKVAAGNIANALLFNNNTASLIENAIGGSGNDSLFGNTANNALTGGRGNDTIDGRGGSDTAVYSGARSNYSWVANADGTWTVSDLRSGSPDGIDTVKNVENLKFSDLTIALSGSSTPSDPPAPPPPPPSVNLAPVARQDNFTTARNKKLVVSASNGILKNDTDANSDPLTASLVAGSSKGTVALAKDGSFTFTPKAYFVGTTAFTYRVSDGKTTSNTATVVIKVGTQSGLGNFIADGHDHGLDQIPAVAVASFGGADSWVPRTAASVSAVQALASGGAMLDFLLATISGLDSPEASFDFNGDVDVQNSLPDFLAAYASEFALA